MCYRAVVFQSFYTCYLALVCGAAIENHYYRRFNMADFYKLRVKITSSVTFSWELNPGWLHGRQAPYLLYYLSSPFTFLFLLMSLANISSINSTFDFTVGINHILAKYFSYIHYIEITVDLMIHHWIVMKYIHYSTFSLWEYSGCSWFDMVLRGPHGARTWIWNLTCVTHTWQASSLPLSHVSGPNTWVFLISILIWSSL